MERIGWMLMRWGACLVLRAGPFSWCALCGPRVRVDEDGCCASCGAFCVHETKP